MQNDRSSLFYHSTCRRYHDNPCPLYMGVARVGLKKTLEIKVFFRKRAEHCFESTVSEERTHWVSFVKTRWVPFGTQRIGWEELTEFSSRNSVRAKKLTEFGVCNRTLRNLIRPVSENGVPSTIYVTISALTKQGKTHKKGDFPYFLIRRHFTGFEEHNEVFLDPTPSSGRPQPHRKKKSGLKGLGSPDFRLFCWWGCLPIH